jgi:hypothetical protein
MHTRRCLQYCMWGVVAWATKYNVRARISYFFESGHKNQAVADSFINFIRGSQGIVDGLRYIRMPLSQGSGCVGLPPPTYWPGKFGAAYRKKFGPVRRPVRLSFQKPDEAHAHRKAYSSSRLPASARSSSSMML